ncbi:MAG: IS1595 family transposase [Chitinophagaceae bacterium]
MNLPFKTLPELMQYFNTEEKAKDFLEKMRWPDGKVVCPICGKRGAYRNCDFKHYTCREMKCRSRFTVTVGTMMENTKLPLAKWFAAIWLITAHKKGISSCQLARDLGIGQKAAWFLNHRIREMVADKAPELLQDVVSADECYVGGRWANMNKTKRTKLKQSGQDNKTAVMGMAEREGKARLTVIGKDSFKDVIRKNVDTGAILVTDEHAGYTGLEKEYNGHVTINHSQLEFIRDGFTTNNVEGIFGQLKRMVIGIYHQVSPYHLQAYCHEAVYRYNTRKIKDVERFVDALKKTKGRLKWKDLVNRTPPKYKGIQFVTE